MEFHARFTTLSLACPIGGQVDDLSHDLYHQLGCDLKQLQYLLYLPVVCGVAVLAFYNVLQKLVSPLCEDDRALHDVDRSGEAEQDQAVAKSQKRSRARLQVELFPI